jgi:hypothetical protein
MSVGLWLDCERGPPDPGRLAQVPTRMRRQASVDWIVLGAFLFFSICMPLDHVCFDRIADGLHMTAGHVAQSLTEQAPPQGARALSSQHRMSQQKEDVCPACLWSQNLLLNHATVRLAAARATARAPVYIAFSAVPLSDFFQSTFKRGPPCRPSI